MPEYGIAVTVPTGFAPAVERTRAALAEQGFGILTEIDVAATMKSKLGVDLEPYLILGACNPPLAHEAICIDRSMGLLLPCNVVVRGVDATHTIVEAMDPDVMVAATGNNALAAIAESARARITAALTALTRNGVGAGSEITVDERRSLLLSGPPPPRDFGPANEGNSAPARDRGETETWT